MSDTEGEGLGNLVMCYYVR